MKGKKIIAATCATGIVIKGFTTIKNILQKKESEKNRQGIYYDILLDWLDNTFSKRKTEAYLLKKNIKSIAIYGSGTMGILLSQDLKNSAIEIVCFIDQTATEMTSDINDIPVVTLQKYKELYSADAIVITPVHAETGIISSLEKENIEADIISLKQIINQAE